MSFKRKGPGVIISTGIGVLVGAALVGGSVALLALPALAESPASEVQRPHAPGHSQPQTSYAVTPQ